MLTSELSEMKNPHQNGLPKEVIVPPASRFNKAASDDSIKSFIAALENYFHLMSISDPNYYTRFTEALLQKKTLIWFKTQNYDLKHFFWHQLKSNFLMQFRPTDYAH